MLVALALTLALLCMGSCGGRELGRCEQACIDRGMTSSMRDPWREHECWCDADEGRRIRVNLDEPADVHGMAD